ncbi:MAG: nucleotidyl transferase AbiEii/AbiGii toxin family protein [Deltaproteobacteria bacterium]|nr:nucleotidyl transferase AbiEii/AbiGii toxin family protein [Deltaproteobacteria bacterium]
MNRTPRAPAGELTTTGFGAEPLEKVHRLLALLDALGSHPFLKTRLALKGGTALHLFHFDVPRLSVDIDLNYLGATDPETMLAERPKVEQAVQAVCSREGLAVRHVPTGHAGGKWRLGYLGSKGAAGNLELDINFLLRTPLWPCVVLECRAVGPVRAAPVRVLDLHELAAGKLAALLDRSASRDVFDARALLAAPGLDRGKLRVGFVVYGGISRRDWRTVSPKDVNLEPTEVERELVPMLRAEHAPARGEVAGWTRKLVAECRKRLSLVLPLRRAEREFLRRLNEEGDIVPELISADAGMQATLRGHPGLRWKALNVRRHRGVGEANEE